MATGRSPGSRPVKQMAAAPKAVTSRVGAVRTSKRADKSSPASSHNFMERLPSEILIKILSYLDASALYSISHVSKLLFKLANDNDLWKKLYINQFRKKTTSQCNLDEVKMEMATVGLKDHASGFWKWKYFKTMATYDRNKRIRQLGLISCRTGLPSQTLQILRNLHITWELTVSDKSGRQRTHELSWSCMCKTSVTLCWSGGGCLPDYQQISTLQLHGVRRIALNCPGLKEPGWRSLMAKIDMQAQSAQVIGQDRLVELRLIQPGFIIGVWRDRPSVAFIMHTLHHHKLVERSIHGSPVRPYMESVVKPSFDDIDPEYGLHDYQLNVVLHDTEMEILSGSFAKLFCRRADIRDGYILLTAISRTDYSQCTPLCGRITLPWRCEALRGTVQNCCILNMTLLDEFRRAFWCVSSPVSMMPGEKTVSYDYDGDHFLIHYQDSDGQVKIELVWMTEQKQFVLTSLVVCVAVRKVNNHFSRNY